MFGTVARVATAALMLGMMASSACAQQSPPPNIKIMTIGQDKVLADVNGMALYTFVNDKTGSGTSACNGSCAQLWPPLSAPGGYTPSGDWSVVTRQDGGKQLAYRGMPLYTYSKDTPGEDRGNGFRGNWHVATPSQ